MPARPKASKAEVVVNFILKNVIKDTGRTNGRKFVSSLDGCNECVEIYVFLDKKNERAKYLNPMNRLTQRFNMLANEENERPGQYHWERIGFESQAIRRRVQG